MAKTSHWGGLWGREAAAPPEPAGIPYYEHPLILFTTDAIMQCWPCLNESDTGERKTHDTSILPVRDPDATRSPHTQLLAAARTKILPVRKMRIWESVSSSQICFLIFSQNQRSWSVAIPFKHLTPRSSLNGFLACALAPVPQGSWESSSTIRRTPRPTS